MSTERHLEAITDTQELSDLLDAAQVETLAALRAIEDAAADPGTRRYVPADAVDELAETLEDLEALSVDPSLLLGEVENGKL